MLWESTTDPIRAALMASQLCQRLASNHLLRGASQPLRWLVCPLPPFLRLSVTPPPPPPPAAADSEELTAQQLAYEDLAIEVRPSAPLDL